MFSQLRFILCWASVALGAGLSACAQVAAEAPERGAEEAAAAAKFKQLFDSIDWKTGGAGPLGGMASLEVPSGYRFTAAAGTIKLMEAYGNLTNGLELGYISPLDMGWFAVFEFQDCGYVKDDEKDKLDAAKILKQLKEGQVAANQELTKRGMPTLEVLGWQTPPFYNLQTNNLEWAIRLRSSGGGETINYKTKLLGRRGVMDVVLVCDEALLPTVIPQYEKLLKGFAYKQEESYAAFSKGDKVAKYGLTGLIVGGGLLVAAKTGLLAKLWKPIVIGLLAIGAFFKRIFTGKTQDSI
ncbi:MAG: DUF2167 domain-containing protein [Verrucomicrobia bacterium]|nr:DUF2167 domain-containing protein [Verrucomicrobiota bacterium]